MFLKRRPALPHTRQGGLFAAFLTIDEGGHSETGKEGSSRITRYATPPGEECCPRWRPPQRCRPRCRQGKRRRARAGVGFVYIRRDQSLCSRTWKDVEADGGPGRQKEAGGRPRAHGEGGGRRWKGGTPPSATCVEWRAHNHCIYKHVAPSRRRSVHSLWPGCDPSRSTCVGWASRAGRSGSVRPSVRL